jgi:hypothetical protein
MKSRIQMAGVAHGSQDKVLWKGELPVVSGIPGMRVVLHDPVKDSAVAFSFKQMCLEINTNTNESEQVIYVSNVDRSAKPVELVE